MDKVKSFLEQHVQWVALGLAGVVILWVVWGYLLRPGLDVQVGSQTVGPGRVDDTVRRSGAANLESAMQRQSRIDFRQPNLGAEFDENLAMAFTPPVLADSLIPLTPFRLERPSATGTDLPGVTDLPSAPPAEILAVLGGRAYVDLSADASAAPVTPRTVPGMMPPPPAGRGGFPPGINRGPERRFANPVGGAVPFAQNGNGNGNGVPEAADGEDVVYNLVRFAIDPTTIADRFRRAGLPARVQQTAVLDVNLVREQQMPDGSWGERKIVARLRNNPTPPMPADARGGDMDEEELSERIDFARDNPSWILQPPFYAVLAGDDPAFLELIDPEAPAQPARRIINGVHEGFDPRDRTTWPPASQMTPAERQQIRDARTRPAPGNEPGDEWDPGMGGGDGWSNYGSDGGGFSPGNRSTVPATNFQNRPRGPMPPRGGPDDAGYDPSEGYYPGEGEYYPPDWEDRDGWDPGMPGVDFPSQAAQRDLPPGEFNPNEFDGVIEGWAFDEEVVPGVSYRYRIDYSLKNPLFRTTRVAADEALAEVVFLATDDSEGVWSDPIQVEGLTFAFMSTVLPNNQEVRFRVFRWQRGEWQAENFNVAAGDALGRERNGVDFRTGMTLVDVRREPGTNTMIAIVTDAGGRLVRRTVNSDREDPKLAELERAVSQVALR